MDHDLSVDLVLQSLPQSYSQFVLNFNMNKLEASLPELANMSPILRKRKGMFWLLILLAQKRGSQPRRRPKRQRQPNRVTTLKRVQPKGSATSVAKKGIGSTIARHMSPA